MSTVITPEDLKEVVGNLNIKCSSTTCERKAVACVNIEHECSRSYMKWVYMCQGHYNSLQAGTLVCKFCGKVLPCVETVWL